MISYKQDNFEFDFKVIKDVLVIENLNLPFIDRHDDILDDIKKVAVLSGAKHITFRTENLAVLNFLRKKGWAFVSAHVMRQVEA